MDAFRQAYEYASKIGIARCKQLRNRKSRFQFSILYGYNNRKTIRLWFPIIWTIRQKSEE